MPLLPPTTLSIGGMRLQIFFSTRKKPFQGVPLREQAVKDARQIDGAEIAYPQPAQPPQAAGSR